MKKLLLPIILLLLGTGSGVGAALVLKPPPEEEDMAGAEACLPTEHVSGDDHAAPLTLEDTAIEVEYAKLSNQFIVPVIEDEQVIAMVVISLSVEVPFGGQEVIYSAEPKLRDAMLQVMFNHANIGGFSGNFTTSNNMKGLREDLLQATVEIVGAPGARDILIMDIVRQDI